MSTKWLTIVRKAQVGPGWVLEGDRKVVVSEAARTTVLHFLADHATDDTARVAQLTLASEIGLSRTTIWRALTSLEFDGWVERERRHGKKGWRLTDEIRLLPMVERPTPHGGEALETLLEREKSLALSGPRLEENMRSESDACNDGLVIDVRDHPTKPKAKSPEKFNPVTLGDYMVNKVRRLQWGTPGAVTAREYGGHFRRWHHDEGVCYREIKVAIDLFCEEWPGIDVPAGRLFIKQRFTWITRAKEEIYQQELPVKQAANRAMWDQIQADLDHWLSENPDATQAQEHAMTAALWQTWKQDPRFAISYT